MSKTVCINIDDNLERSLEKARLISGREREELPELVTDVLRRFVFQSSFERAQDALAGKAKAAGFSSEDDIFEKVS